MSSLGPCFRPLLPQLRYNSARFWFIFHPKTKISFNPRVFSSSKNDDSISLPKQNQLGYDPSEELFGLSADPKPSNALPGAPKPRSWFGPNGQYIRELPCPSCRGRGYTPCTECGIERSRSDCSQCNGKGIMTCRQCSGDRVIWEESIDEQPWEKARSIVKCNHSILGQVWSAQGNHSRCSLAASTVCSPLKVKEDDEVDNLDLNLDVKKKSKRVYQSPPPEVGLKISRSLKSLNAKTGLFSKRMKIIHRDPMLQAQRVAAIKKAKGTAAARKRVSEALKAFFSDPENRRKRSISMKGVKFYCRNCGREGHRRHYCPEIRDSSIDKRFKCRLCGEKGHNKRTCPLSRLSNHKSSVTRHHLCKICRESGHNSRTCPQVIGVREILTSVGRTYTCRLCRQKGHNVRTCPSKNVKPSNHDLLLEEGNQELGLQ